MVVVVHRTHPGNVHIVEVLGNEVYICIVCMMHAGMNES